MNSPCVSPSFSLKLNNPERTRTICGKLFNPVVKVTASVVKWSEFLDTTDSEIPGLIPDAIRFSET
jgi:hypothetical protein